MFLLRSNFGVAIIYAVLFKNSILSQSKYLTITSWPMDVFYPQRNIHQNYLNCFLYLKYDII
jgi:hypothetical protein